MERAARRPWRVLRGASLGSTFRPYGSFTHSNTFPNSRTARMHWRVSARLRGPSGRYCFHTRQSHRWAHSAPRWSRPGPHTPTRPPRATGLRPRRNTPSLHPEADTHHPHLLIAPAGVAAWRRGECLAGRCGKTLVGSCSNHGLPQPETPGEGHLVRRFLLILAFAVARRASHHKSPWRDPHVLEVIQGIESCSACGFHRILRQKGGGNRRVRFRRSGGRGGFRRCSPLARFRHGGRKCGCHEGAWANSNADWISFLPLLLQRLHHHGFRLGEARASPGDGPEWRRLLHACACAGIRPACRNGRACGPVSISYTTTPSE